ncbi:MAG TPA: tetratricopeptide repeat protein [Burkholderiaceae bacterium]|nr:tetratricopeptide repeat protein [Burkholderiaceae bacterium]
MSLVGIGGSGKTRLATRYGRSWLGEFPGGVWFCDLASARGADGIARAVAQGLDVPLGRDDPVIQIGHAIAGRGACLVILDNFEQVARDAPQTLGHWLARAGQARFVVTTREVLGLAGEVVQALPPLSSAEGVALFAQRARAAKPDFQPNAEDDAALAPLVALLDGLPLAIELAAARARVMPPRMLLARMSERFKLLASKGRGLDRQSTLRAAFDWSWDLLAPPEKTALAQLSVFEGGFTLEAAEGVLDLSDCDGSPWVVDVVHSLVDKSVVRSRGEDRFDLLVSVQAYAAEHLQTVGRYRGSGPQALASARHRHIEWFAALGPLRAAADRGTELDNLMVACRRAVALGTGDLATSVLEAACAALSLGGPFKTGVELAESVCAIPDLNSRAKAQALSLLAHMLVKSGASERARGLYDKALACSRSEGDRHCEAMTTHRLGVLHHGAGKMQEARAQQIAALQMARELGYLEVECLASNTLGNIDAHAGQMECALSHYERALALARERGDLHMQGGVLGNLGLLHVEVGRTHEAHVHYEQSLAIARDTGNRQLEGIMLCNLGMLCILLGRPAESEAMSRAALVVAKDLGNARLEASVLCNLGIAIECQARPGEAKAQFEAAVALARALGDPRAEGQFLSYLGLLQARQGQQDEARDSLAASEALLRSASDAFGLGVLLTSRAEAHHLTGDAAAAMESLAAAAAIAAELGAGPSSEIGLALARVRTLIDPLRL